MADVTLRKCDVFGGTKDVKRYRVSVVEMNGEAALMEKDAATDRTADLSPRAYKRLLNLIDKGVKPSTRKPGTVKVEAEVAG